MGHYEWRRAKGPRDYWERIRTPEQLPNLIEILYPAARPFCLKFLRRAQLLCGTADNNPDHAVFWVIRFRYRG